jgi:CRP-like cAMP-binding protein
MTEEAKRAALAEVDFFKGCTERERTDIARLAQEQTFEAGAEVCHESDFGRLVFVVLDGEADITVNGEHVATAQVGDVVGERAMLGDGHRTATVTARVPMTVLVLEPEEIDSVLAADPSSARRLGGHQDG